MTDARLFQILAHAYGANGKVSAMPPDFHPATAAAMARLIWGHPDLGTWCGPGGEYTPAEGEMLISNAEAAELTEAKLLGVTVGGGLATTAQGRDTWRRMGSPTP